MKTVEKELWYDRKRIMGLPISFTRYAIEEDRLITKVGFFRTELNEVLLYRILDIKMVRTLGQKLCGVGTITVYTADTTHPTIELKNIKNTEKVRRFLSKLVETRREEKRVMGKEMFGAAAVKVDGVDFVDVDGDGIPD